MDPVIVGCSLQWLSRIYGSAHFLLFLLIVFGSFESTFTLNTIPFPLFLRLLLMRNPWRLDKVLLGELNRAKGTFVMLCELAYFVLTGYPRRLTTET